MKISLTEKKLKIMSVSNKKIVMKFIDEFIKGNNTSYIKYLTDDIKWNIVGMPSINGRQNFLQAMEMMGLWQNTLNGNNSSYENGKNIIAEGDFVVIENFNNPSHCDIYRINNGKIKEVTTYVVDTSDDE
jgi:hypothetical protein